MSAIVQTSHVSGFPENLFVSTFVDMLTIGYDERLEVEFWAHNLLKGTGGSDRRRYWLSVHRFGVEQHRPIWPVIILKLNFH